MKSFATFIRSATLAIFLISLIACSTTKPSLEGVWERHDSGQLAVKILSDGYFSFGQQSEDGEFVYSGGGSYEYSDGKYTETINYHWIPSLVGLSIEFDYVIDDEGLWYHTAQFQSAGRNYDIDEIWQPLPPRK